jgi:hypothetical protein
LHVCAGWSVVVGKKWVTSLWCGRAIDKWWEALVSDPWRRFEAAFTVGEPTVDEMKAILADLSATNMGSAADRAELSALATTWLAKLGEVTLNDASAEVARAVALGRAGWPSLYLTYAALSRDDAPLALDSIGKIPPGYFDDLDLHWRTVEVLSLKAEALTIAGSLAPAREALARINAELRDETEDEFLASPQDLVRRILLTSEPALLLETLVAGLDLDEWFPGDLGAQICDALADKGTSGFKRGRSNRLMRRKLARGIPFETKAYVCVDVFDGTKPVLLVSRADGDWVALCGDEHPEDADFFRVVGLGHVIENDPSIAELLDLPSEHEAERAETGGAWVRVRL